MDSDGYDGVDVYIFKTGEEPYYKIKYIWQSFILYCLLVLVGIAIAIGLNRLGIKIGEIAIFLLLTTVLMGTYLCDWIIFKLIKKGHNDYYIQKLKEYPNLILPEASIYSFPDDSDQIATWFTTWPVQIVATLDMVLLLATINLKQQASFYIYSSLFWMILVIFGCKGFKYRQQGAKEINRVIDIALVSLFDWLTLFSAFFTFIGILLLLIVSHRLGTYPIADIWFISFTFIGISILLAIGFIVWKKSGPIKIQKKIDKDWEEFSQRRIKEKEERKKLKEDKGL